jgi:ABC-2 type transport system ATP-binding protein
MMWFCGGHGVCNTGTGPAGHFEAAVIAWLQRYLMGKKVATGPGFEWLADDAVWRHSAQWPPPHGKPLVATGSGTLAVSPLDTASGTPLAAAPAANAVNVEIPEATAQVVGQPQLKLAYSGTGTATHVFAQIVDEKRNLAVGNQVTPLPVKLDGAAHTLTRPLEGVAASVGPGGRYHLQLIGGSQVYGPVRGAGAITFSAIRLALPTVGPCQRHRQFTVRVPRHAKVFVAGKRVKVHGRRVRVNMRHRQRITLRTVTKTRSGKVRRTTRVYERC